MLDMACRQRVHRKLECNLLSVVRFAFGQKGINPFAAVGIVQVAYKVVALRLQMLTQIIGVGIIEQLFDAGHDVGRSGIKSLCQGKCFLQGAAAAAHCVDQSKAMQPLGVDALAAHQYFAGQLTGQGSGQRPTATSIGRQANRAVRHHEHGVVSGNTKVTSQRQ